MSAVMKGTEIGLVRTYLGAVPYLYIYGDETSLPRDGNWDSWVLSEIMRTTIHIPNKALIYEDNILASTASGTVEKTSIGMN